MIDIKVSEKRKPGFPVNWQSDRYHFVLTVWSIRMGENQCWKQNLESCMKLGEYHIHSRTDWKLLKWLPGMTRKTEAGKGTHFLYVTSTFGSMLAK